MTLLLWLLACADSDSAADDSTNAPADECNATTSDGEHTVFVHDWWDDVCVDEGYSCGLTCSKLHALSDEAGGDHGCGASCCNISVGDRAADELLTACMAACDAAVAVEAGAATWESSDGTRPGNGPVMINRADAAAWGGCVEEYSCENLADGVGCAAGY